MTIQMMSETSRKGRRWLGFSGKGKFLTVSYTVFST
jgi:hypothetical protein